ncbi:MAG: hypothetical protein EKK46_15120 [Rhodocyclaceae bacterium]|nr:MAG: hypothetical protein EKK46_15120 [Rhodocyclaceae bacterium]
MARYRKIDPRIWNDEKFRAMSDNGKLAFLFLLTHPHMTALGAMRATIAGLAEELGWGTEAFREAFAEALLKGMAEHDPKACLIALPNFIRYNSPESPNVVKAWVGALDLLPECMLKNRTITRAKAFAEALPEAFAKALPEAFAKGMPYQEQEQEQEQEKTTTSPAGDSLPCPADRIVDTYHRLMPDNPKCKVINTARRRSIKARWNEAAKLTCQPFGYSTVEEGIAAWERFFSVCAQSYFLTGRATPLQGKPPFFADIDFLMSPKGFAGCLENKYHRGAA